MENKLYCELPLVERGQKSLDRVWSYLDLFILVIGIAVIGLFLGLSRPEWQERSAEDRLLVRKMMNSGYPNERRRTPEVETNSHSFFREKNQISAMDGSIYSVLTNLYDKWNTLIHSDKTITQRMSDSGSVLFSIFSGAPRVMQEFALTRLEHLVGRELATFLVGLFFGSEVLRDQQLSQTFSAVGLSHVLSASGYNVGLIARMCGAGSVRGTAFFRRVQILMGIFCYAWMTGGSPPVFRATVQASYVLVAGMFGRPAHPVFTVLFALLVSLLLRPEWLKSVSLWLSVFASLGLVVFSREQKEFSFSQLSGFSTDLRTTVAASIFTVPLVAWRFAVFTPITFLVNPLFLWTIGLWMRLAVVLLAVGSVLGQLIPLSLFQVWELIFDHLLRILEKAGSLPFANWSLGSFRWTFGFFWLFLSGGVLFYRRRAAEMAQLLRMRLKTEE